MAIHMFKQFTVVFLNLLLFCIMGCSSAETESTSSPDDLPKFNITLSVKEAYKSIPHRYTEFNKENSSVSTDEKKYLTTMFDLINQAIIVKITAHQAYTYKIKDANLVFDRYDRLLKYLDQLTPPSPLKKYHHEIIGSLKDHRDFFEEWESKGDHFPYRESVGGSPKVKNASQRLHQAYGILIKRYQGEDSSNKQSFFDYHCALDFL